MKILVLGAGLMGTAAVKHLIDSGVEVAVGSRSRKSLTICANRVKIPELETFQVDVTNHDALVKLLRHGNFDVVINALPHQTSVLALKAEVDAGVNVVDMAFESEQMELRDEAVNMGITIVPGCGAAPGLSNMLVGYGASQVDQVEKVHVLVGGLPQRCAPPLDYKVVFHLETVWLEYTQKARVVVNGKVDEVDALSGLELVEFPGVGKFEAFYTDGLASLLHTFKENEKFTSVKEMFEKTLRYPGHAEKIKTLIECGLFGIEPIKFREGKIVPRQFLTALLTPKLELGDEKDMLVMRVEVVGDSGHEHYTFDLVDYYDKVNKVTSMARTTAYTASIVAQLIGRGKIDDKGVIPTEELGVRYDVFKSILEDLSKKEIKIKSIYTEVVPHFFPIST